MIELYQLPEWPCARDSPDTTIKEAFADIITDEYLTTACVTISISSPYAEVEKRENLVVILEPYSRPRSLKRTRSGSFKEGKSGFMSEMAAAALDQVTKIQESQMLQQVHNYRPLASAARPVHIYHPLFANFQRMINRSDSEGEPFSSEELDSAHSFIHDCSKYHRSRTGRKDAM
ncbi:uncharacterized protein PHACADRAFT_202428 [Phanerochaete carnosa HHB-10118-sp]|uniref:Uncharacterized protein n=1 Tax=Phanerochaete carnosa (strain HHB-10118-sp) TaxID=650164 RepID=K5VPW5_PHACS|nr:uncharacterized protein PHACADRAFT_202428 [Phanerochaete carnosa HHB-10118-sp]EKM48760.1 hypothetical protein PHACADRAFT_202428 [Phanerochaete carnosa HHB-10118-sp]